MLEITNLRDGAVLDHRDGKETDEYLEVQVEGLASSQATVLVNGVEAEKRDRLFRGTVRLTKKLNQITVQADDAFGVSTQTITVAWDKKSFKRYNFFVDDCSFFLRSLALNRPKSIFEELFLKRLHQIHRDYGTKFTLNLFYHDDHHDFSICDMPDCYKGEFHDNSDWLKMSFHAKNEFPDRPYEDATPQTLAADYDLVHGEICRFAGEDSFMLPLVIHWAMTRPTNFTVLQERGVQMLTGGFLSHGTRLRETYDYAVADIGYFYEKDVVAYLTRKSRFYDRHFDMFLMSNLVCCNGAEQPLIRKLFKALEQEPRDTLSLMTHEQYSYPDYFNYLPDHLDRVELACRLATEAGYQPVYFAKGFAGNHAWD